MFRYILLSLQNSPATVLSVVKVEKVTELSHSQVSCPDLTHHKKAEGVSDTYVANDLYFHNFWYRICNHQ